MLIFKQKSEMKEIGGVMTQVLHPETELISVDGILPVRTLSPQEVLETYGK